MRLMLGRMVAALVLAALPTLAASPAAAAPADVVVDVRVISFDAPDITVRRGTQVDWQNVTSPSRVHDVVSSIPGLFVSDRFGAGVSYSSRFDAAGTFPYICTIHDQMIGVVRVPMSGAVAQRTDGPVLRIRLATQPLPADSPYLYRVSRLDPGATDFVFWRYTRRAQLIFQPPAPGTYEFVMRTKNVLNGWITGPSGDSPVLTIDWAG